METLMPCNAPIKMHPANPLLQIYYTIRPAIPRRVQIMLRRRLCERIRQRSISCWPVSVSAAAAPRDWRGWKDDKEFALILTHDVEKQTGYQKFRKLVEIEKKMGFVSSFNFVPERYRIDPNDLEALKREGFEVGVHGLNHDGKLLRSEKIFLQRAERINEYIRKWGAAGFRAPSMHHDLELFKKLNIEYDLSTFDTDPFEPQSNGVNTIFPFRVLEGTKVCYWEFPYTLPQDSTIFIILQEKTSEIWTRKTDWIVRNGGMVLLNVHPDYINFGDRRATFEEYPVERYVEFLDHVRKNYAGRYWNPLPRELASYLTNIFSDFAKKKYSPTEDNITPPETAACN